MSIGIVVVLRDTEHFRRSLFLEKDRRVVGDEPQYRYGWSFYVERISIPLYVSRKVQQQTTLRPP